MQAVRNAVQLYLVAEFPQFSCILLPLVAQWVVLRRDDQRIRLICQALGQQRGKIWIVQILVTALI